MAGPRHYRPTLRGSRIYERHGWLHYFSSEPIADRETGKLKKWHRLCRIGSGDELRARNAVRELLASSYPVDPDFSVVFAQWRIEVLAEREKSAPRTPEKYAIWQTSTKALESLWNAIARALAGHNVGEIKPFHLWKFLKPWNGRRVAQVYLSQLSKFFGWAAREGFCDSNPATAKILTLKAPPKREVSIAASSFRLVRDAVKIDARGKPLPDGEMVQCYIDLTYLLYQRTTEVRLLRWNEIDDAQNRIFVEPTKTRGSSGIAIYVPISPSIRAVLIRLKRAAKMSSLFVFHTAYGQVYTASALRGAWNRACKRVGVRGVTLKDIRSMAATAAKKQGFTGRQIMVGLAHKKEETTEGYFREKEVLLSEVVLELPFEAENNQVPER